MHSVSVLLGPIFCSADQAPSFITGVDPESFVREGPTLKVFFLFLCILMRGGRIQISLIPGHQRPANETPLNGVSLAGR